jgi:hypothetical protein
MAPSGRMSLEPDIGDCLGVGIESRLSSANRQWRIV